MNHRSSVIKRMAVYFIMIELILLNVVSLLIYRYTVIQEKAETTSREEAAERSVEQIQTVLDAAMQMTQNLAVDSRLSQLAYHNYLNEYERSKIILGLINNLNNMRDLNPAIADVTLSFPDDDLELSSSSGYNNQGTYTPPAETEVKLTEFLYYDEGILRMRIVYPLITSVTGAQPDYACEVTFDQDFLDSYLISTGDNVRDNGSIVLLQPQKETQAIVYSNGNDKLSRQVGFGNSSIRIEGERYQAAYKKVTGYPITLAVWRRVTTLSRNMRITLFLIITLFILSLLLILFLLWRANRDVARPLRKLVSAFGKVSDGDLSTRIQHEKNDEFGYIYDSFNDMTGRNQQLIEDIKEQHHLLQNAELAQLQAQIDPHFLYNSFNIIKYMAAGEEYDQINEFVSLLAEYYRFINKEVRQAIPLAAEVRHMETYVNIQQMRFEGRIQADLGKLPEQAQNFMVPKLILQPLVENSYKHGLHNKLENGIITVSYNLVGDILTISVEDNGGEMTSEKLEEVKAHIYDTGSESISHALANTRRRLELAYGDPDLLEVSINEEQGLRVKLTLDITKEVTEL